MPILRKILCVEDDLFMAQTLKERLENGEIEVQIARRMSDAFFKVYNQIFDYILLDLRLQGESGESLIQFLKRDEHSPNHHTPIIVISGNVDNCFLETYGHFISKVFTKPFDVNELYRFIHEQGV